VSGTTQPPTNVLLYDWSVHNLLGFGGKVQRGESVHETELRRRNICDHDRVRTSAQRILQETSELAVSEGNARLDQKEQQSECRDIRERERERERERGEQDTYRKAHA
jgi:hypothetical protein